jgi:hypothetical protein
LGAGLDLNQRPSGSEGEGFLEETIPVIRLVRREKDGRFAICVLTKFE